MVNAVFAWVISNLFIGFPASVLSVFIQIPLAIWIGFYTYKKKGNILLPSIIVLIIMYGTAVLASYFPAIQIDLVQMFGGEGAQSMMGLSSVSMAFLVWMVVLMVYVYMSSVLAVWLFVHRRAF